MAQQQRSQQPQPTDVPQHAFYRYIRRGHFMKVPEPAADGTVQHPLETQEGRQPLGVVCAIEGPNGIQLGWSWCHRGEQFESERGRVIAAGRALEGSITADGLDDILAEAARERHQRHAHYLAAQEARREPPQFRTTTIPKALDDHLRHVAQLAAEWFAKRKRA